MYNKFLTYASLIALSLSLIACSPYPENPLVALGSKESRIANTWKVVYATDDDGSEDTDRYDTHRYTFSEDGDAVVNYEFSGVNVELTGEWNLLDDNSTFQLRREGTLLGVPYDQTDEFTILKLTKDEFWLQEEDDEDVVLHLEPF